MDESKPWVGIELPCNAVDRLLFDVSTIITIGNAKEARFWHHHWLDGEALRNLVTNLFELVKRKKIKE